MHQALPQASRHIASRASEPVFLLGKSGPLSAPASSSKALPRLSHCKSFSVIGSSSGEHMFPNPVYCRNQINCSHLDFVAPSTVCGDNADDRVQHSVVGLQVILS